MLAGSGDLLARHGRAACRHALSRRFRGTAEAGRDRTGKDAGRGSVHRRNPHGHRCRRDQRRGDGCLQPAEAGAFRRHDPLRRLDDLQGISQSFRKGPRAAAPVPEDRRERTDDRRHDQDPEGPAHRFRGTSQGQIHARCDEDRGRAVGALHQRPQIARQGDRRDRRGRRDADAGAAQPPQEEDHGARRSSRLSRRWRASRPNRSVKDDKTALQQSGTRPEARRVRSGQGGRASWRPR